MSDASLRATDLRAIPFLEDLPDEALAALATRAARRSVVDGEDLFVAGGVADEVFAIERGQVTLRASDGRRTTIVMSAGPGELLGWSALRPMATWMTTGRAVGDVSVIVFPVDAVLDLAAAGGPASRELVRRLVGVAAAHLDATQNQLLSSGDEGVITGG